MLIPGALLISESLSFLSQESFLNPFDVVITKNKKLFLWVSHSLQIYESQKDVVKPHFCVLILHKP